MGRYSDEGYFSSGRGGRSYTGRGRGRGRGWGKGRGRGRGHYNKGMRDKENENNANFTTHRSSSKDNGVGSIKDLANELQTINSTIRDTLVECAETNESLIGIQSQVVEAMQRVGKVNKNLISLKTHTNLVLQKSLEMIKLEEEVAQHQVDMPVTPEEQHRRPLVETKQSKAANNIITPTQKQQGNGIQPGANRSFGVLDQAPLPKEDTKERVSSQTLESLEAVSLQFSNETVRPVTPIQQLHQQGEELLPGALSEISPPELHEEKDSDVATPGNDDNASVQSFQSSEEDDDDDAEDETLKRMMAAREAKQEMEARQADKKRQDAIAKKQRRKANQAARKKEEKKLAAVEKQRQIETDDASYHRETEVAAEAEEQQQNAEEQNEGEEIQRTYVSCQSNVEDDNSEEAADPAMPIHIEKQDVHTPYEDPDEESIISQEEEEEDENQMGNGSTVSMADALPHSDQESAVLEMIQAITANHASNDTSVAKSMVYEELDDHDTNAKQKEETNEVEVEHPTPTIEKQKVAIDKLSDYIKPHSKKDKSSKVSPIFDLIQNENTVEVGRKLMSLELDSKRARDKIEELIALKRRLTGGIKLEEESIKSCQEAICRQDRHIHLRWGMSNFSEYNEEKMREILHSVETRIQPTGLAKGKRSNEYLEVNKAMKIIQRVRGLIENSNESIDNQTQELERSTSLVTTNIEHLRTLRAQVVEIKGEGMKEDVNFHVDRDRDERGFTLLMIAAQNDDFFTAKTCFDLGADAYVKSPEGLTAIDFSYFFGFERVTNLILQNGGSLPKKQSEAWGSLESMVATNSSESKNWDDTLKVAETAALPTETLTESPETCENDKDKRMPILSLQECHDMDFTCFESRLVDSNINSDQVKRVVLLDQNVYNWCLSTDQTSRANFANLLEGLKPVSVRREGVQETRIHRRAIIGAATTYEVLSAKFKDSSKGERTALFTPFVSGEVNGITNIGVLVWTVAPDSEASLYKTLIANTEFMRHKVKQDDRFLPHKELVLELGKDMHLLDLRSTSIMTTSTMNLYILNLDNGDLDRIHDTAFFAKKRVVANEEKVNKAIFHMSQEEEETSILASERRNMSTLLTGGAGTGKTLLLIRKVAHEDPSRKVLVVSRLPRLIKVIESAVKERRGGIENQNQSFTTYDELLQLLAKHVAPDKDYEQKSFNQGVQVRFDCDDSNVSFSRQFVADHLNKKERKDMLINLIEPLTLWHAIIVIKSQAQCAVSKQPLSLDDYLALPASFGLTRRQRELCYALFLKYEQWRESEYYWDEMDRVLYVLKFGPSVFRDRRFVSWARRVNRFGEMDLLNDTKTEPLHPFFYDIVCADEAQDFTEIDIVLFSRMSASIRYLFLSADSAQSVELGVKMRGSTVNDAMHSLVKGKKKTKVKDVLQYISLQTNHRTHAQNLAIGQAVRRILARSFKVPMTSETALINGQLPKTLSITDISNLANTLVFRGGNIVFIAPDENIQALKLQFSELGIQNDLFGVREAKGLEFDAVALIGFFSYIEERGSSNEWRNVLRWLSSSSSLTKTSSTGERVAGRMLEDCDYKLSAPNVSDEAMMVYTALTRARNNLYLIEVVNNSDRGKKKGALLADFAFNRLSDCGLTKKVQRIDEGKVEMSAAQHKARGVTYVTQALGMIGRHPLGAIFDKLNDAKKKFGPDKGNDKDLFDKCEKHINAISLRHSIMNFSKRHFLMNGEYNLTGRFEEVLQFEQKCNSFFSQFLCDSFLVDEVVHVRRLMEEIFEGTPYENHFKGVCQKIKTLE